MTRRWPLVVPALAWLHFAVLAWLSPLQDDDWLVLVGRPTGMRAENGLVEALHHALVAVPWLHVALTPLLAIALLGALVALVRGRKFDDAVAFLLVLALMWLAVPRACYALSQRGAAVRSLYPTAILAWLAARYVLGRPARHPRALASACFIAAFVAGALSITLGVVASAALAWTLVRRRDRSVWAWAAWLGVTVGVAYAALALSASDLTRWDGGVDGYVRAIAACLRYPIVVASGALALVVVQLARGRIDARGIERAAPAIALAGWATALALALAAVVQLGTHPRMHDLFACGAVVAVAATRVLVDLASDRTLARLAIAGALVVDLVFAYRTTRALAMAHADFVTRCNTLAVAPHGGLARLAPYRRYRANDYTAGEDFISSEIRDRVATLAFGLRGAVIDPPVYGQDRAELIELDAVVAGGVGARRVYSADLTTAREQFADELAQMRPAALPRTASLRAPGLAVPGRAGTPVELAWLDGDRVAGAARVVGFDWLGRMDVRVDSATAEEAWALPLVGGSAVHLERDDDSGTFRLPPGHHGPFALVACDAHCALGRVIQID